jgi:hypothetical protein
MQGRTLVLLGVGFYSTTGVNSSPPRVTILAAPAFRVLAINIVAAGRAEIAHRLDLPLGGLVGAFYDDALFAELARLHEPGLDFTAGLVAPDYIGLAVAR